jgi:hypothetical protein
MEEKAGKPRLGRWLMGLAAVVVALAAIGGGLLPKGCGCGGGGGSGLELGPAPKGSMASWPAAAAGPSATATTRRADLLAGQWEGRWASSTKNLGGKLSCTISQVDQDHYRAAFLAQSPLGTQRYDVTLTVSRQEGRWNFQGSKNLGILSGGLYRYDGRSDGSEFQCTYDSAFDRGVFRMLRPEAQRTKDN